MGLEKIIKFLVAQKTHFPKFVVVGIVSTIFNYTLFYILFSIFGINYLVSSAGGYLFGVIVGFCLNKIFTFGSKSKRYVLEVSKYFSVYVVSLFLGLGLLKLLVHFGVNILLANVFNIGLTTITNYLGSKYLVFFWKKKVGEENSSKKDFFLRQPKIKDSKKALRYDNEGSLMREIYSFFTNPLFLGILFLKIIISFFFVSQTLTNSYLPFIKYFSLHPLSNVYQHFYNSNLLGFFPHPQLMLLFTGIPFLFFSVFGITTSGFIDSLLIRIPLLFADVLVLGILTYLIPKKKQTVMLLYWLSPIVIYVNYVIGELDLIPISLLLLSYYFLSRERMIYSATFFAVALATKTGVILVAPFFIIYLWTRKYGLRNISIYILVLIVGYIFTLLPFFSTGFINEVYFAPAHLHIFDLTIGFSDGVLFYLTLAIYLYLLFKAISFNKMTRSILFMFTGVTFTLFVTLINPPATWYVWSVPFLVYFFSQPDSSKEYVYWSFNLLFILYILLIPNSEIFKSFHFFGSGFFIFTPLYNFLEEFGINSMRIFSIIFTLLTANLVYVAYWMYNQGIKGSLLFQQKEGIPTIGISGDSGTGKTTTANILAKLFGANRVNVISGDDIHRWERGHENWGKLTHLNPIGNKIYLHHNQIDLMKKGKIVYRSKYNHNTGNFTPPLIVKPKDYIIDEGLHTFMVQRKDLYNLKIYMDPEDSLKIYWKMKRDIEKRGYSKAKVKATIKKRKKDSHKYILPQKVKADLILRFKNRAGSKENTLEKYDLEIWVGSNLDIEYLIGALRREPHLSLSVDYPNTDFQRVIIRGNIDPSRIFFILKKSRVDYYEYGVGAENILPNFEGLIQLFSLYCLDKKMSRRSCGEFK